MLTLTATRTGTSVDIFNYCVISRINLRQLETPAQWICNKLATH